MFTDPGSPPMSDSLAELLKTAAAEAANYDPCMSLYVNQDGRTVQLLLESARNFIAEWIPGERGDVALLREHETGKIIGVVLPLYNAKLSVFHDGPLKINDGFLREGVR